MEVVKKELEPVLEIEFKESRVGNEALFINGCQYNVNRRSGDTTYWRCTFNWCPARACFKAGQLRFARGEHVCPQNKIQKEKREEGETEGGGRGQNEVKTPAKNTLAPTLFPIFYRCQQARKSLTDSEPGQGTSLQIKTEPRSYIQFDNDLSSELNLESTEATNSSLLNHSNENQVILLLSFIFLLQLEILKISLQFF